MVIYILSLGVAKIENGEIVIVDLKKRLSKAQMSPDVYIHSLKF
jgi:hypothetical protein